MEQVNSIQNKEILWNILYKNGIFNNIDNNKIDDIKNQGDNIIRFAEEEGLFAHANAIRIRMKNNS